MTRRCPGGSGSAGGRASLLFLCLLSALLLASCGRGAPEPEPSSGVAAPYATPLPDASPGPPVPTPSPLPSTASPVTPLPGTTPTTAPIPTPTGMAAGPTATAAPPPTPGAVVPSTPGAPERPILYNGVVEAEWGRTAVTLGVEADGDLLGPVVPALGVNWSPDGSRFAYLVPGGASLEVATLEGDRRTVFNSTYEFLPIYAWPEWSPDGSLIAVIEVQWCGQGSRISYVVVIDPRHG